MTSCVPFVFNAQEYEDCAVYYPESPFIHIPLFNIDKVIGRHKTTQNKLWVDTGIYFCHYGSKGMELDVKFPKFLKRFDVNQCLFDIQFIKNPDKNILQKITYKLLDECQFYNPKWISIPQLPIVDGAERNKINKLFASQSHDWKVKRKSDAQLIVPILFTSSRQYKGKAKWKAKLATVVTAYNEARANGVWVVDTSLDDQSGSEPNQKRFHEFDEFHAELRGLFESSTIIAGPYWGLNIVLWAKGRCNCPAVAMRPSPKYYIPGLRITQQASNRIAIASLRRLAVTSREVHGWLQKSLQVIPKENKYYKQIDDLVKNYSLLMEPKAARKQVLQFYSDWLNELESVDAEGRSIALYQDFSAAFVAEKKIFPKMPPEMKKTQSTSKQYMLLCI